MKSLKRVKTMIETNLGQESVLDSLGAQDNWKEEIEETYDFSGSYG